LTFSVSENGIVATSLMNTSTTTGNSDAQRFNAQSNNTNLGPMLNSTLPSNATPSNDNRYSCGYIIRRVISAFRWGKPEQEVALTALPQNLENTATTYTFGRHTAIRSTYMDKSIEAKKKVIRMLFVVVLEFFICWTPLHVLNTWYLFHPEAVYKLVGSTGVSLVQLLAYVHSCCNPITYCFMNKKFRQAFIGAFECFKQQPNVYMTNRGSEISGNDSALYAGRASTVAKSCKYIS
jgi:hypothetical protein